MGMQNKKEKKELEIFKEGVAVGRFLKQYEFTGKPNCISCGKPFKKLQGHSWEPNCKHGKGKWSLSVGGMEK